MPKFIRLTSFCLLLLTSTYFVLSKIIFDNVYLTSKNVIDEEFHLPLGYSYCNFNFSTIVSHHMEWQVHFTEIPSGIQIASQYEWHHKVTTLPGLYIMSALFLGPFKLCSVYWLRLLSLACSVVNIFLYYALLSSTNKEHRWKNVFGSINMALIPPIFFLGHFYYTDVASLTTVLLLLYCFKRGKHCFASFFGMVSILMRQTNVIFVGMVFALFLLNEISKSIPSKYQQLDTYHMRFTGLQLFARKFSEACILAVKTATLQFWLDLFAYTIVLLSFCLFVIWNGSIVVGDKSAHEASIHVPQLFYFSLFSLFFGWPYFVKDIGDFITTAFRHKLVVLLSILACIICVHFNTQVHPYLLADNRHYMFYIWNRLYGKYILFRYLIIPAYVFSLYIIIVKLCYTTHIVPTFIYLMCISAVLIPQKLIELRYFFVPYVYFRIHIENTTGYQLFFEFVTYLVLNVITFYLFFTKTIHWDEFTEPQRLIW